MIDPSHLHFSTLQQMLLSQSSTTRLLMACAMGGLIGIEREWRHKDSGLRTNMLISMGSALFTIMSVVIAGDQTSNRGQIAANIVQGVGFLGAGLILHTKSKTIGLTSAATVFVVAAIGMTCGAGLYIEAAIGTALVLTALLVIGAFEGRLGWKRYAMVYEVRANVGMTVSQEIVGPEKAESVCQDVNEALRRMQRAILTVLDKAQPAPRCARSRQHRRSGSASPLPLSRPSRVHQHLLQELRRERRNGRSRRLPRYRRRVAHRTASGLPCIYAVEEICMSEQQTPVWFITGCSTGFGKELAKLVIGRVWRAVVTARKPEQVQELVAGHEDNALAVGLDGDRQQADYRRGGCRQRRSSAESMCW